MTGAEWAYVPGAEPDATLFDEILAATSDEGRTDLLVDFGAFAQACDDRTLFAATADNVVRGEQGGFVLARALLPDVEPLDRAASAARVMWHLTWDLVLLGEIGAEDPAATVDEHAARLGDQAGLAITLLDVERARRHEAASQAGLRGFDRDVLERDLRAVGALTPRGFAAGELLDARSAAIALTRAYDQLVAARRDRDAAEAAAVEAAASKQLAQSLGEVLERDEWIRARLRTVKATRPARALIEARKRLLGRDGA
jgi:hypothetical protein